MQAKIELKCYSDSWAEKKNEKHQNALHLVIKMASWHFLQINDSTNVEIYENYESSNSWKSLSRHS